MTERRRDPGGVVSAEKCCLGPNLLRALKRLERLNSRDPAWRTRLPPRERVMLSEARALCEELERDMRFAAPGRDEALRGIKAWLLAPNTAIYEALMRRERVPLSVLDQDAVARFGLRRSR